MFVANQGVLHACGNFSANAETVDVLLPDFAFAVAAGRRVTPGRSNVGWGHRMGIWASGHMDIEALTYHGGTVSGSGPRSATTLLQFNRYGMRFL